jgi:hypothetical protein
MVDGWDVMIVSVLKASKLAINKSLVCFRHIDVILVEIYLWDGVLASLENFLKTLHVIGILRENENLFYPIAATLVSDAG